MQGQFSLMTLVQNQAHNYFQENLLHNVEEREENNEYFVFDELKSPFYLFLLGSIFLYK